MSSRDESIETLDDRHYAAIVDDNWRKGDLRGLLLDHQLPLYDLYYQSNRRKTVLHCSRRLGKSWVLLTICSEVARMIPHAEIKYGASTQKSVREIIHPLMREISLTAPISIRPVWSATEMAWIFPETGSQIKVSGLDEGRAENLRGTKCHLAVIDEAGFVDDLHDVIVSILMPQFLTTDGRMILASSSPRSPDHAFIAEMNKAMERGSYILRTIHDDSRPEVIARIPEWMEESGGADSTAWRREYLCEIVVDEDWAIVPEFAKKEIREAIIEEVEIPPYFVPYTIIDLGYIDHTAAVFGFIDFRNALWVALDEILLKGKNSKEIADAVLLKEKELWINHKHIEIRRYADGQPLNIADMNSLYSLGLVAEPLNVIKVPQDPVEKKVNTLRVAVQQKQVRIHPRMKMTIAQLGQAVWDSTRKKMARQKDYGHFDLVSAFCDFVRVAGLKENPYPINYQTTDGTHFYTRREKQNYNEFDLVRDALFKGENNGN